MKKFLKNNKAVSISVGFILTFSITILVFTSIVYSFYTLTQKIENSATEESFKMISSRVASKITTEDTLVSIVKSYDGNINTLEYELKIPDSIAGKPYIINITNETITMESKNTKIVRPISIESGLVQTIINSGNEYYKVKYNKSTQNITISAS